jgi:hypothetical protein
MGSLAELLTPAVYRRVLAAAFVLYFVVFAALAVGTWLFFRGRTPEFKWRWSSRAALFSNSVIGASLVLGATLIGGWMLGMPALLLMIAIGYVNTRKTTVCHQCGKGGGVSVGGRWGYCPKRGTQLKPPAPLWSA